MRFQCVTFLSLLSGFLITNPSSALEPGYVLVSGNSRIVGVDRTTGDRTMISGSNNDSTCVDAGRPFACCTGLSTGDDTGECMNRGLGPALDINQFIAFDSEGRPVVTVYGTRAILRIDPSTGDRSVLSGCVHSNASFCPESVGEGPNFRRAYGIAREADGSFVVSDIELQALFRVNPETGDRTIISGSDLTGQCRAVGDPFACCIGRAAGDGVPPCANKGAGPNLIAPAGVAIEADGEILAADRDRRAMFRIDPVTGSRTYLSATDHSSICFRPGFPFSCCAGEGTGCNENVGTGPEIVDPQGMVLDSDGSILVVENDHAHFVGRVFRVDPVTGDRIIVTGPERGEGTSLWNPVGLAIEYDGNLLVSDFGEKGLFRVDPVSGDRKIISREDYEYRCESPGYIYTCCTGLATGDGSPPCTGVGSGPPFGIGGYVAVVPGVPDQDGDGVVDDVDLCLGTEIGEAVNKQGCSIAQLVPCSGPREGGSWRNHGDYVSSVAAELSEFERLGVISGSERMLEAKGAAHSACGR